MIVFWFCFWAFVVGILMEAGRDFYKFGKSIIIKDKDEKRGDN